MLHPLLHESAIRCLRALRELRGYGYASPLACKLQLETVPEEDRYPVLNKLVQELASAAATGEQAYQDVGGDEAFPPGFEVSPIADETAKNPYAYILGAARRVACKAGRQLKNWRSIENHPDMRSDPGCVSEQQVYLESVVLAVKLTPAELEYLENRLHSLVKEGVKKRRQVTRRKRARLAPKELTEKQAEAVQIVGECKGDKAEAARRLGVDRKTLSQHYKAAMAKLGKTVVRHVTQSLPTDRRGQESVSQDNDRRQ